MRRIRPFFHFLAAALLCGASAATLRVPAGASLAEIALPDGFKVTAELALTPAAREQGLMFREELPPDRGMLFVFDGPGLKTFWMKNTYIPLDMVFLDAGLEVLRVFHRVPRSFPGQPESELARASSKATLVLELPAGTARAHGVRPGRKLGIAFLPARPRPVERPSKAGQGR